MSYPIHPTYPSAKPIRPKLLVCKALDRLDRLDGYPEQIARCAPSYPGGRGQMFTPLPAYERAVVDLP